LASPAKAKVKRSQQHTPEQIVVKLREAAAIFRRSALRRSGFVYAVADDDSSTTSVWVRRLTVLLK